MTRHDRSIAKATKRDWGSINSPDLLSDTTISARSPLGNGGPSVKPLVVARRELRLESGGEGRYRGGHGHWLEISAPRAGGPYRFSPFFDRVHNPARGYGGGADGAPGLYWLERPDGTRDLPNPKATVWVEPDTRIVIGLPGGGGFGPPPNPAETADSARPRKGSSAILQTDSQRF